MNPSRFNRAGIAALAITTLGWAFSAGCMDAERRIPSAGSTGSTSNSNTSTSTSSSTTGEVESFGLTYVSGHLGSYWDCPGDALSDQKADAAEPGAAREAGAPRGDCADDDCGGPLNCEHAEVTIRLANTGETDIADLSLQSVELLLQSGDGGDPQVVVSQVIGVDRADGQEMNASIPKAGDVDIIVRFKGLAPSHSSGFNSPGGKATVRLRFQTPKAEGEVTTPEIQTLPAVAT